MTDNVSYTFPGGAEIVVPTALVPRKNEVVWVEGRPYRVAVVNYDIKIAHTGETRGTTAMVELEPIGEV